MLSKQMMIYPDQIKAARALVGYSQTELAERSGVGIATVKRIESSAQLRGTAESFMRIQNTLEDASVEFIPDGDGKGRGVRHKTPLAQQ